MALIDQLQHEARESVGKGLPFTSIMGDCVFEEVVVVASDFHSFKFKGDGFPKSSDGIHYDFDPLSNTVHRVILVRPEVDTRLFRAGTYLLVTLALLAALFAFRGARYGPGTAHPGGER